MPPFFRMHPPDGPPELHTLRPAGSSTRRRSPVTGPPDDEEIGGGGIRTPEALARLTVFKTVAFSRSATPPGYHYLNDYLNLDNAFTSR